MSSPFTHYGTLRTLTPMAVVGVIGVFAAVLGGAQAGGIGKGAHADSAAVAEVVDRYHQALSDGDSATVLSLLANDAIILESGDVETRDDYRSHHLSADIEFARAVPSVRGPVRVGTLGEAGWAISTSKTRGTYRGRTVDSQGAELMVVTREVHHWKVRAIHWSSQAVDPSR